VKKGMWVIVDWTDAGSSMDNVWRDEDMLEKDITPYTVRTVGKVLRADKETIHLAGSYSSNGMFTGDMQIPRRFVDEWWEIEM